jgi:prepilin-type N-terminal cleavage/methylation domain-containing protein
MNTPRDTPAAARSGSRSGARAFTLVELAVVMAMLATLMTIAYPSFADWLAKRRVTAAAETLQADISEARLLSAQRGLPVHLNFADGAQACWAASLSSGCDCRIAQACRIQPRTLGGFRGVALVASEPTVFTPEGLGEGGAELRSARGHVLRVAVSRLGRSHICAPGGADPRYPAC